MEFLKNTRDESPSTMQGSPGQALHQVRCRNCNARLFDSRVRLRESEIDHAGLIVKCWRCAKLIGLSDEAVEG